MRRPPLLAPFLALAFVASPAVGQETEASQETLQPVALLTLAGVERARGDVGFLFETVDRGEMAEVVDGYLEFVNDLGGVDRTKPLGVMLFLKPGFVPIPNPVGFLPISDLAELRTSLSFGENLTTEQLADDLLEIKGRGRTLYLRLAGDYGLISNEREFLEERLFPDPLSVAAPLAARYDLSVQALPGNIPPGMRKLFQNLLRQNTQTQMQRRDEEPEAAYRARKTAAKRNLEVLEAMLEGSDEITFGIDASAERRTIEVDLSFDAVAGTAWAEELAAGKARATPFDPLHEETAPLSAVASITLNRWDREALVSQLDLAKDELGAALSGLRPLEGEEAERLGELEAAREAGRSDYDLIDPGTRRLVEDVIEPLKVTAENGELDGFLQFRRGPGGGMTVLGAASIGQGDRFSQGVPRLLDRLLERSPADGDLAKGLTMNVAQENGVTWHQFDPTESNARRRADRLTGIEADKDLTDEQRQRRTARVERNDDGAAFFGGPPVFYLGLGRDAVWLAVGTSEALVAAQEAVAAVQQNAGRVGAPPQAPIRAAINVGGWFSDSLDDLDENALRAREAFADGSDRLTIRAEATGDDGGRLRLVFGEGFIRFLALSITDRYDESQL